MSEQLDYDAAVEWLADNAEETIWAWRECDSHQAGKLFEFCAHPDRISLSTGCLTMVHRGYDHAQTPELTKAIRADSRLHGSIEQLQSDVNSAPTREARIAILAPYAEWQKRMDVELNRT